MTIKVERERKQFALSLKRLRRARYLYIYLCREAIITGPDATMNHVVKRMHETGLYAQATDDHSVRFLILRRLFKVHNPRREDWYEWIAHYKWRWHEFRKTA